MKAKVVVAILILSLLLVAGLACGGSGETEATPTPTPDSKPTHTYNVRFSSYGHGQSVDIYRNGVLIVTVSNIPGFYTDNIGARGKGTYTYRVCDAGTQHCSNQVTVKFGGG